MSSANPSHPPIAAPGRVVGIDLGSRRIGVAVTDSAQLVATAASVVRRSGNRVADHRALAQLVADYEAVGVVAGLPVSLSGHIGPAAAAALDEVEELRGALPVEVETVDERLTTQAAARGLRAVGRRARQQRPVIDQAAATVLLQTWVERRRQAAGTTRGRQ
ncbi:MAG TPA: Holliday junction resolvase RuvX [Acidimicrobiales bacterium]